LAQSIISLSNLSGYILLITVENLIKTYGWKKFNALDGINLQIQRGEIFGLIGPNGAGKTTLMGCLLGLLKPTSGTILINGRSVHDLSVKAITGFSPERPNFDAWLTVEGFLHYHHMLAGRPPQEAMKDITNAILAVELEASVRKRLVRKLSRGMLQRLGLAQVLIGKPQLCFLDEPTSGMDPLGMKLVRNLLTTWKSQGVTVVLNSHHLDEVERACDRVALITKGKIDTIEVLNATTQNRQVFMVRWGKPYPSFEMIQQISQEHQVPVQQDEQEYAKFLLADRSEATGILKALLGAGVQIEEAVHERKALVDLFINAQAKEPA
jgi:ABC-2 type transport system ATP-binding protein